MKLNFTKGLYNWTVLGLLAAVLVLLNFIGSMLYFKLDMTKDQRYSLANSTVNYLSDQKNFENRISIQIYLDGNMPSELKYTIAHSNMNGVVVGNYAKSDAVGHAFPIEPGRAELQRYALEPRHCRRQRHLRYRTSEISTPSSPCDRVRASPPWLSLMRRRTSFCESA